MKINFIKEEDACKEDFAQAHGKTYEELNRALWDCRLGNGTERLKEFGLWLTYVHHPKKTDERS